MSEQSEPRRSGRSNKGQHSNNPEMLEEPITTPRKRKSLNAGKSNSKSPGKQATEVSAEEEQQQDDIIRCVCGQYSEEEDVERDMICCDKCSAWQHNDCMGLTFARGNEPEQYFCEQCRPEDHQDLLDKMARGEKPWEEVARERERAAAELNQKGKNKRSKKATGAAASNSHRASNKASKTPEPNPSVPQNPVSVVAPIVVDGPVKGESQSGRVAKRRRLSKATNEEKGVSRSQVATPVEGQSPSPGYQHQPQQQLQQLQQQQPQPLQSQEGGNPSQSAVSPVDALSPPRKKVVTSLVDLFVALSTEAIKQGSFQLPPDQKSTKSFGEKLGLEIELALCKNLWGGVGDPSPRYRDQVRNIYFNVKKNPSLRDNVLVGSITPDQISTMSTHDMASEELRRLEEEMKREADRQHIIVHEEVRPRIRRTHKGEEIVEDPTDLVLDQPVLVSLPRRATLDSLEARSAAASSSTSTPIHKTHDAAKRDQSHQQKRESGTWERPISPQIPDNNEGQQFGPAPTVHERTPSPTKNSKGLQIDTEIDDLLQDETYSPPYSPKAPSEGGTVWRGRVFMNNVGGFEAEAQHVAGADPSERLSWNQLLSESLQIDGRIDVSLATTYLCGLRYGRTTDVCVGAIGAPSSPSDNTEFQKLFEYFLKRNRYGVVSKHTNQAVKDAYIVPVEAGSTHIPEYLDLMDNVSIPKPVPQRLLLVVLVVRNSRASENNSPRASVSQTPTEGTSVSKEKPIMTPQGEAPTPAGTATTFALPTQVPAPFDQHQPSPQTQPSQTAAAATAPATENTVDNAVSRIFGPNASIPSVQQLLQIAPNVDAAQLEVIAGIISRVPEAAHDYALLMNTIVQESHRNQA